MSSTGGTAVADVLHVLPSGIRRGAQRYAQQLVPRLGRRHEIAVMFGSESRTDLSLGVPDSRPRRLGLDARAVLRLRRLLSERRPSVVVAHGGESLKYAVLARYSLAPIVYCKIGTLPPGLGERGGLRLRLHQWLVHRAAEVVAVSDDVGREVIDVLGVSGRRVTVIPNGRDPEEFEPRVHAFSERPRIGFVGRLTAQKRPELFLDIIEGIRQRGLGVEPVMIGDGPLSPVVEERALALDVALLGERDDVPALLNSLDMLVFTSAPEGEGMPGVLIEAGMAGLPVVSTRVPGATTVVQDGVTGFVVRSDDRAGLLDRVTALTQDHSLRAALGGAARDRCIERFSLGATTGAWEGVIERVIYHTALARPSRGLGASEG